MNFDKVAISPNERAAIRGRRGTVNHAFLFLQSVSEIGAAVMVRLKSAIFLTAIAVLPMLLAACELKVR
jgi:hypothetical protein